MVIYCNFHPIMLTIEPRMVIIFWACSPISFEGMYFWYPFLGDTPNHTPLIYRCPNKKCIWIRVVVLTYLINTKWCNHLSQDWSLQTPLSRLACWLNGKNAICHLSWWKWMRSRLLTMTLFSRDVPIYTIVTDASVVHKVMASRHLF